MAKFKVEWRDVRPSKTHRGIRTFAALRLVENNAQIAELDDLPEAIVAHVVFEDDKYRTLFLEEARAAMTPKFVERYGAEMAAGFGEEMFISEYARELLEECINAYMRENG